MYKAIYLGPKPNKTVWHNHGDDADGSPFNFTKGVPLVVPDSLAQVLNTAPNFRLSDGTLFITDPQLKVMHDEGSPVSILLIRYLGGIGDILMVTPAIRGVREKFPKAEITFAINKAYFNGTLYEVIEHNPHLDKIVDTKGLSIDEKRNFTSWVDLSHPCARYESYSAPNVDKHRTEIYCDECGVSPSVYKPEIFIDDKDEEAAMEFFSGNGLYGETVIAMQPFAADLRRVWGVERMFEVAKYLKHYKFIWFDYRTRVPQGAPENIIDAGAKRIRTLAAIVKRCKASVSCDSFMLQIAGAMDVPTVAIFGATNPYMRCKFHDIWTPVWNYGSCAVCPCWYGYPCLSTRLKDLGNLVVIDRDADELKKRKCIESISVEQVVDAIQGVLHDKR